MKIPDQPLPPPAGSDPAENVNLDRQPAATPQPADAPAPELAPEPPSHAEVQSRKAETAMENAAAREKLSSQAIAYEARPEANVPERDADRAVLRARDLKQRADDLQWGDVSRQLWARQRWPEQGYGPRPKVITPEVAATHPEVAAYDQAKKEADSRFGTAQAYYKQAAIAIHNGDQEFGNKLYAIGRSYEDLGKQSLEVAEKIRGAAARRDQGMKNLAEASLAAPKGLLTEAAMAALPGVFEAVSLGAGAAARLAGAGFLLRPIVIAGRQTAPALARLSYEEYLKVAQMSTPEAKQFLGRYGKEVTDEVAGDFVTYSRGQVMDQALQDGSKFRQLTAEQVHEFTSGAVRVGEAERMLAALQNTRPGQFEAAVTRRKVFDQCRTFAFKGTPDQMEAAAELQNLVLNDRRMAHHLPGEVRALASRTGLELSETEAKSLIREADARMGHRLRLLKPESAAEELMARGDIGGAMRLESFLAEMGGHVEVVRLGGNHFRGRVFEQWDRLSTNELAARYNLSDAQAKALQNEYQGLRDVQLGYHDLGPAGKTDPYTMYHMSKPGGKGGSDFLLNDAIKAHNDVFAHHNPVDAASRFEKAVDHIAALRQDRSYRGPISWEEINNKILPEDFKRLRAAGGPDVESQIGWLKAASAEMERLEKMGINLERPQDEFYHLKTPAPYLPASLS